MNNQHGNNLTDQLLVEKVFCGDTNAFKNIIKNTEGLVAQILFKMIPNSEDRKDIAQEIYLKTFHNLRSFKFQSKLSTWVGKIAYNTCVSYFNKKKLVLLDNINNDNEYADEALDILACKTGHFTNETEELIFNKDRTEILKIELEKLSPVYKTLITLYHNEELGYSEIAEITELPEGTVKSYLSRARKKLRDNLLLTYKKEAL